MRQSSTIWPSLSLMMRLARLATSGSCVDHDHRPATAMEVFEDVQNLLGSVRIEIPGGLVRENQRQGS